jgi:hypothetical protein
MGTATFTVLTPEGKCTIAVDRIGTDNSKNAPPPTGLGFLGSTFDVVINPPTASVKVCYAYPPQLASKNAGIYKLNETANPQVWELISGAEVKDGKICVTTTPGLVSLLGQS